MSGMSFCRIRHVYFDNNMREFGDRVRIREAPETLAARVAGLEGDIHGFTSPSATGVDVIGGAPDDHALNVNLDAMDEAFWFRPDLVILVHHNAGLEICVGGVTTVRQADGSWVEMPKKSQSTFQKFFGWLKK
jgi:hypothetical protein